jgi:hypothetical protein
MGERSGFDEGVGRGQSQAGEAFPGIREQVLPFKRPIRIEESEPAMHVPTLLAAIAFLAAALIINPAAEAHHGWSAYDADKAVKVEAPVEAVRYRMPHGEIEIDYEGERWVIVLAPTSRLQARGLPEEDLQVGDTVLIEAYPKRDGTPEMRAERITVKGKTIELR